MSYDPHDEIRRRMAYLVAPIDKQIMMCDDEHDVLMLACAMLSTAKNILDQQVGPQGRKQIMEDYIN